MHCQNNATQQENTVSSTENTVSSTENTVPNTDNTTSNIVDIVHVLLHVQIRLNWYLGSIHARVLGTVSKDLYKLQHLKHMSMHVTKSNQHSYMYYTRLQSGKGFIHTYNYDSQFVTILASNVSSNSCKHKRVCSVCTPSATFDVILDDILEKLEPVLNRIWCCSKFDILTSPEDSKMKTFIRLKN